MRPWSSRRRPIRARAGCGRIPRGRIWVSEWNSGNVSVHDPADGSWKAWKLPGDSPRTYSVYVDDKDKVWLTDFSANAIVRFDPVTEKFNAFPSDKPGANVRQMAGRPGEAWGGESGTNRLVVIQTVALREIFRRLAAAPCPLRLLRPRQRKTASGCSRPAAPATASIRPSAACPAPISRGVIGRRIGGDPAFDYSPVLRKARDDGLRWDAARLDSFLADPAAMFPGLWMSMRGIEDAAERRRWCVFWRTPPRADG